MVEYTILLSNRQFRFLSDNFEALAYPVNEEMYSKMMAFERNSRSTPLIRSLYGIIGFERIMGLKGHHFHNFFIPLENERAVLEALHIGIFSKEFPDEDLEILGGVYKSNCELRKLGINHRYPFHYVSEISRRTGIPKNTVKKSLINLIGILGFCSDNRVEYHAFGFFVPKAREELIKKLLS